MKTLARISLGESSRRFPGHHLQHRTKLTQRRIISPGFGPLSLVFICLALALGLTGRSVGAATSADETPALMQLNIPFVQNQGQKNPAVAYYAATLGGTFYVTKNGELVLVSLP